MPSLSGAPARYWRSILLILLVGAGIGVLVASVANRPTSASAQLILATPGSHNQAGVTATGTEPTFVRYVKQRALFTTSEDVLNVAASKLYGVSTHELYEDVRATASSDGAAITVTAHASTAAKAVAMSNAVVAAYRQVSLQQFTDATQKTIATILASKAQALAQVDPKTTSYASIGSLYDSQVAGIQVAQAQFGDGVTQANLASIDDATRPAYPWWDILVGGLIGLAVGIGLAYLRAYNDHRVVTADGAAALADAVLFGDVSHLRGTAASRLTDTFDAPLPDYAGVWAGAQERFSSGTVMVLSASGGVGRTTTALQMAAAAAHDGEHVLLIDATSNGHLSETFELADVQAGFHHLIAGRATLDQATYEVVLGESTPAWIIPAGEKISLPTGLQRDDATKRTFVDIRGRFDLVLVDTDPGVESTITALVGRHSEHVLLVVKRGEDGNVLDRFLRRLRLFGLRPEGVVFTDV